MILALKSDRELHITPKEACNATHKYAGLVELSDQTEKGREKMRRSVGAFVKMIEDGKCKATGLGVSSESYRNPALPSFCPILPTRSQHESCVSLHSGRRVDHGHDEDDDDRPVDLRGLAFVDEDPPSYSASAIVAS